MNNSLAPVSGGAAQALAGQSAPQKSGFPPISPTELWQVMERQTALYTNLESSSVPAETAVELLDSVLFCVMKAYEEAPAGTNLPLAAWLLAGQRVLTRQCEKGLALQKRAQSGSLPLENPMYQDALKGTRQFFTWYDIRCMAHQTPVDLDYPPALPVSETLKGIDYISQTLRQRIWEDAFCRAFPLREVLAVLTRHSPHWQELPLNLFEPVFVGALGGVLLGSIPQHFEQNPPLPPLAGKNALAGSTLPAAPALLRTGEERHQLWKALHALPQDQLAARLKKASTTLCNILRIWGSAQRSYYQSCAATLPPRILAADEEGFAHIFL